MERNNFLERLQGEIRELSCDVKAEAVLVTAVKNGLPEADFMIACNRFFFREYSPDIYASDLVEDADGRKYLQVNLSRSGIYDSLPEGMFFVPEGPENTPPDAANMAAASKRDRLQEQELRRFFMPFDDEIFRQRLQLESAETQLLEGFQSGVLNDYFKDLWDIPPLVGRTLGMALIRLLPYACNVAGDPERTGRCLEAVLNEPVRVQLKSAWVARLPPDRVYGINEQLLGVDTVIGSLFPEEQTVMEFHIGPLKNSALTDYLPGGKTEAFLKTFYGFFVPADAEVVTSVTTPAGEKEPALGPGKEPVLGYTGLL